MTNPRKTIALLVLMSMTLTACGEKTSVLNQYFPSAKNQESIIGSDKKSNDKSLTFDSWKKLVLTKDKNNFSLAKIFATHVSASDKEKVQGYIEENLSTEDLMSIIEQVGKNYDQKKNAYLYHDAPWMADNDLIENSIMRFDEVSSENLSTLEQQLIIETSAKIRNKFLEDILTAYSQALESSTAELSSNFAVELQKNNPQLIEEVEADLQNNKKDSAINKLKKGLQQLEYFNFIRQDAALTDTELVIIGLSGAIAYKIYDQVKDTKTFKNIKKLISEAQEFKKKIDKAAKIVNAIKDLRKKTSQDVEDFKIATHKLTKSTGALFDAVKKDLDKNPEENKTLKKQISILYKDLFTKQARSDSRGKDSSYESYVKEIDNNLNAMSSSFSNMGTNFDTIVNNSVLLADALGIKLGKDALKVVKSAQTVSKIVNLAASTFKGFVAGGYVGGAVALVGSSSQLFGENKEAADQSRILAQLAEMDMKLDEILKLQRQTIQLQLDTMKMIRDLALMIDDFHQKEMRALTELKDESLTNTELSKTLLNRDIRKCESLIEYQLLDINSNKQMYSFRMIDADIMDLAHENFYGNLKEFQSFESIVRATHFDGFSDCQNGINDAFGKLSTEENPILATYNANGEKNFITFQREVYQPLVNEINTVVNNNYSLQFPLHLPMKSMKSLGHKYLLMKKPLSLRGEGYDVYDFKNLISPSALTRYASSLLILYPLLDFDRDTWEAGPNAIIDRFFADLFPEPSLDNDDYKVYLKTRSLFLLKNALYLTQSSIAQEALLSGEPILDVLYEKRSELFKYENPCKELSPGSLACALYSNRLLMKNFLLYSVYKSSDGARFSQALSETGNVAVLENILGGGTNVFAGKVAKRGNEYFLELKVFDSATRVSLPKVENLKDYTITYSENMVKLLKLQLKIIDAIISVSPQFMSDGLDAKYSALILSNAIR